VPEEELPVVLPEVKSYEPTGNAESPLAAISDWVNVKCPQCGGSAKRETNTMPQWAGSCWYYIAYIMQGISNFQFPISSYKEEFKKLLPVDLYIGGVEHAVLHLLYARFWHKVLFDIGIVSTEEPFQRLVNQGLMLGPDGHKMSKSRGNVVSPDEMIEKFGADSLRMYEMFMSPFGDFKPWDPRGITGTYRFLNRVWQMSDNIEFLDEDEKDGWKTRELIINKTIKKVTEDIQNFQFNTAISSLMILINLIEKYGVIKTEYYKSILKIIFPFAPHIAQELWEGLGNKTLLDYEPWPTWDEELIQDEEFELIIQVNGKLRGTVLATKNISQKEAEELASSQDLVKNWLKGGVKKAIFVPNRLINFLIDGS